MNLTLPLLEELVAYADMGEPVDAYAVDQYGLRLSDPVKVLLVREQYGLSTNPETIPLGEVIVAMGVWSGVALAVPNSDRKVVIPFTAPRAMNYGDSASVQDIRITLGTT